MIVNHTINKVINSTEENTESLLDLTADSVSPENLLLNKTAHNSEGEGIVGEMPEGGASDYDELENRPQINSNLLTGNKTGGQLGLQNRVLASTLNIGGQTIDNVEGALSALNESKSDLVNGKVPVNELPVYQPVIGSIQSIGGIVPPSSSGDEDKYLRSDGTWAKPSGGGGGVSDYDDLSNRPKVNGTTLSGDKTGTQLGLQNIVLSSALSIGGQTVTEVEEALQALSEKIGGTDNYPDLQNKPQVNGNTLVGNKTGSQLGLQNVVLASALTIGGQEITEVEPALRALNEKGGGHTILDEDGNPYPQRNKLQFEGCEITDDATNGITVVKCEGGGVTKYAKPIITVGTYTYDGTTQAPTITGFDANVMTLTGTYEAINAGSYTFTIALSDKTSSKWEDDTQDDIVTNWSINAISVAVPTVTNTTKTYNGSAQSPTITRDTANTSINGTTSATKVKSNYSFSIALTDTTNHKWSDNTTAAKSYTWKINPPTGSSYTPINNIQAWLACASIDKTYTTIAQVLADATTLSALMLSNNAADYLVRSTSWVSNITGNQTAMTDIGASDYCADKLLADSTWRTAICDSTYFENVLTTKVPTLSDNTNVVYSSGVTDYGKPAYYAFNGNLSRANYTYVGTKPVPGYIGYKFTNPVAIYAVGIESYVGNASIGWGTQYVNKTCKLMYSDDGTNWTKTSTTYKTPTTHDEVLTLTVEADNVAKHKYWALEMEEGYTSGGKTYMVIQQIQFYGRA